MIISMARHNGCQNRAQEPQRKNTPTHIIPKDCFIFEPQKKGWIKERYFGEDNLYRV